MIAIIAPLLAQTTPIGGARVDHVWALIAAAWMVTIAFLLRSRPRRVPCAFAVTMLALGGVVASHTIGLVLLALSLPSTPDSPHVWFGIYLYMAYEFALIPALVLSLLRPPPWPGMRLALARGTFILPALLHYM